MHWAHSPAQKTQHTWASDFYHETMTCGTLLGAGGLCHCASTTILATPIGSPGKRTGKHPAKRRWGYKSACFGAAEILRMRRLWGQIMFSSSPQSSGAEVSWKALRQISQVQADNMKQWHQGGDSWTLKGASSHLSEEKMLPVTDRKKKKGF